MGSFSHESIAKMGFGDFWFHPRSLGLSEDDIAFVEKPPHLVPAEVRCRIEQAALRAAEALTGAVVGQPLAFDPDEIFEEESRGKPS